MRALVVPVNGHPEVVESKRWDLPAMCQVLDCGAVEMIALPLWPSSPSDDEVLVWFDEEARSRGWKGEPRPRNPGVSALLADHLRPGHYIAGPALITSGDLGARDPSDLPLLSILEISRRLVRAERPALQARPL